MVPCENKKQAYLISADMKRVIIENVMVFIKYFFEHVIHIIGIRIQLKFENTTFKIWVHLSVAICLMKYVKYLPGHTGAQRTSLPMVDGLHRQYNFPIRVIANQTRHELGNQIRESP